MRQASSIDCNYVSFRVMLRKKIVFISFFVVTVTQTLNWWKKIRNSRILHHTADFRAFQFLATTFSSRSLHILYLCNNLVGYIAVVSLKGIFFFTSSSFRKTLWKPGFACSGFSIRKSEVSGWWRISAKFTISLTRQVLPHSSILIVIRAFLVRTDVLIVHHVYRLRSVIVKNVIKQSFLGKSIRWVLKFTSFSTLRYRFCP